MNVLDLPRYTAAYAGRIIGLRPERVRRWLQGYEYLYTGPQQSVARLVKKDPVVKRQEAAGSTYASFLDLVDLLFVKQFLKFDFSLQKIRKALAEAEKIIGGHHFAQKQFFTDGSEIYLLVKDTDAECLLQLLSGGQWVITDIIKQLATQIDFSKETGFAEKWYPSGRNGRIVIDPQICFGSPTIIGSGIRTENVFDLYAAEENNIKSVSSWLNLRPMEIQAAVGFETHLAATV